jgi:hypothetical protein
MLPGPVTWDNSTVYKNGDVWEVDCHTFAEASHRTAPKDGFKLSALLDPKFACRRFPFEYLPISTKHEVTSVL